MIGIAFSSMCCCSFGLGGAGAWLGFSVASTFWFTSVGRQGNRSSSGSPGSLRPRLGCPRSCDETAPSTMRMKARAQPSPDAAQANPPPARNRLAGKFPFQMIAAFNECAHRPSANSASCSLASLRRFQRLRHDRYIRDPRLLHRIHHAGEIPKRHPLVAAQIDRLVRRIHARLVQLLPADREC